MAPSAGRTLKISPPSSGCSGSGSAAASQRIDWPPGIHAGSPSQLRSPVVIWRAVEPDAAPDAVEPDSPPPVTGITKSCGCPGGAVRNRKIASGAHAVVGLAETGAVNAMASPAKDHASASGP